jgi:transposase
MPAKGDRITKRKDGRYVGRVVVHTVDGPKRKVVYGRKYKEVEEKLAVLRGDAARGIVFDAKDQTPDLNPIEEALWKIKQLLRKTAARTKEALVEAMGRALGAVSARDARGFFAHCGYRIPAQ